MKGFLGVASILALMFFNACDSGSSSSSSSSSSKFDVMMTGFLKADGSLEDGKEAVATNADKAEVLEVVTYQVWLKSSSIDYAKYFKSDGSMQEKTTGSAYIAKWYAYEEGKMSTTLGNLSTQTRFDHINIAFPNNGFDSGAKKAVLVLRVYEPGTTDLGADKPGVQDWTITFSKTSATLDLSKVKIKAKSIAAATVTADATSVAFTDVTSSVISSKAATFTGMGTATNTHVTLKGFELAEGTSADLSIVGIKGSQAIDPVLATYLNTALTAKGSIQDTETAYTSTVRVDFEAVKGKKGQVILSIVDNKYGFEQDVTVDFTNTIP